MIRRPPRSTQSRSSAASDVYKRQEFRKAVIAGVKSGKGFRLAWVGNQDMDEFEWWCDIVWHCLDGNVPLYFLIEELAAVQNSTGKASKNFGNLCNQSRKYNGIMHWSSQKPAEVSKTVLDQTENFYIGNPGKFCSPERAKILARVAECTPEELFALQDLTFYHCNSKT